MEVRGLRPQDWPAVRAVYEAGIATGNATFETGAPSWEVWNAAHLPAHRLVAAEGHRVLAWAALAPVSDRCAYAGVAEDSVYVAPDTQGRSAACCWGRWSPRPSAAGSGRCRPGSSPRTRPASGCTRPVASGSSASASA
jgi:hypothetical protein